MRNLKFKTKKIIAMSLVALTIYTSIFSSSVLQVEASTIPLAGEFVSAMLQVYGYNMGFGTTADGMNNTSSEMFAEMQARWNKGEIYEVDGTEIPDLRVTANYINFVSENYDYICAYNNGEIDNAYLDQLNEKSYKASGTLGTKSFQNYLAYASSYIESSSDEEISSDLSDFFNVVTDDGAEITDFSVTNTIFASILCGITAKSQLDATNTWTQPITSNVYTDDYKSFSGTLDNINFQFYKANGARFMTNKYGYIFEASEPVVFTTFVYSGYYYVVAFGKQKFNLNYITTDTNWLTVSTSTNEVTNTYQYTYPNTVYKFQMSLNGTVSSSTFPFNTSRVADETLNKYVLENYDTIFNSDTYELLGNYDSMDPSVSDALKSYSGRAVTKSKLLELSDMLEERAGTAAGTETAVSEIASTITEAAAALPETGTGSGTGTGEYASILSQMLSVLSGLAGSITGYFEVPLKDITDAVNTIPQSLVDMQEHIDVIPESLLNVQEAIDALPGVLSDATDRILNIPTILTESLWKLLEKPLTDIKESTQALADQKTKPWEDDDTDRSNDSLNFFNGLFLLILIIIKLLQIFWHCLQFIVAIFEIPPSTAFLPDEVVSGLHYIKAIEITGIGMSVYDFMMGLIYIIIIFSVIRVLRKNVDRIHIPGSGVRKG